MPHVGPRSVSARLQSQLVESALSAQAASRSRLVRLRQKMVRTVWSGAFCIVVWALLVAFAILFTKRAGSVRWLVYWVALRVLECLALGVALMSVAGGAKQRNLTLAAACTRCCCTSCLSAPINRSQAGSIARKTPLASEADHSDRWAWKQGVFPNR